MIVVHRSKAVKKNTEKIEQKRERKKRRWKSAQDNSKARDRPKEANDTSLVEVNQAILAWSF